jgi:hypothetical protein
MTNLNGTMLDQHQYGVTENHYKRVGIFSKLKFSFLN